MNIPTLGQIVLYTSMDRIDHYQERLAGRYYRILAAIISSVEDGQAELVTLHVLRPLSDAERLANGYRRNEVEVERHVPKTEAEPGTAAAAGHWSWPPRIEEKAERSEPKG